MLRQPCKARPESRLVKTTRNVAAVLSSFKVRNGYQVVDAGIRGLPSDTTPKFISTFTTEQAMALEVFSRQRDNGQQHAGGRIRILPISSSDGLKVGDILEATVAPSASTTVFLVLSRDARLLTGAVLVTGSATILHDVTASNELFLTQKRITIDVGAVKAAVDPSSVLLRYAWNPRRPAFMGLNEWAAQANPTTIDSSIIFHQGDFVMLAPPAGNSLVDIVQVHLVRNLDVVVRRLHRQASPATGFKHDRLLVPSKDLDRLPRSTFKPVSTCHVSLLTDSTSSWVSDADHFFVAPSDATVLRQECLLCHDRHREERRVRWDLVPLRAMEIMCGAGGLSVGLDLSGACETKYALDLDPYSIATFKTHHPNAQVFCGDAGDALDRAVAGRLSQKEGMHFPRRGDVDVIAAGPPCQGFSLMNRTAPLDAERDPRNLLVATVLGWVDHLRPKYLVLENVESFAVKRLGGHEQGMVKFVMKSLLSLGYGCTCGFVQSGAYGCPQSRGRFLLIAAREGLSLPKLPRATHHFLGKTATRLTWKDAHGEVYTTDSSPPAILPPITVSDAISDLPPFDWKDPHRIYAGPDVFELERAQAGVSQMKVSPGRPVGYARAPYQTDPHNSYQERMRILGGQTTRSVGQHQTSGYGAKMVERVVNVDLFPGADYHSWSQPTINKPALLDRNAVSRYRDTPSSRCRDTPSMHVDADNSLFRIFDSDAIVARRVFQVRATRRRGSLQSASNHCTR